MTAVKKAWTKPQLIVISRGRPEESVLTVCKVIGTQAIFPVTVEQAGCARNVSDCGACQARPGGAS